MVKRIFPNASRSLMWCLAMLSFIDVFSQAAMYSHADSLRGSQSMYRTWWDVLKYDIDASFDPADRSLAGTTTMTYKVLPGQRKTSEMQIDLMAPMTIDSIVLGTMRLKVRNDGNAWYASLPEDLAGIGSVRIYYHGIPPVAKNPPWDGGVIWQKDRDGNDWISVACQGFGASTWYPNKDIQSDEPDSVEVHLTAPDNVSAVSNGRLTGTSVPKVGFKTWNWKVKNPINNYNVIPYIGKYDHFEEVYNGLKGKLDVSYWMLSYNLPKAKSHIKPQLIKTLKNLEYWFGPYPFYEDGFKMVQSPHLGMEHQSAIAYGNGFQNGYLGRDLSNSGWGLKWDFIVLHETAHEWFGNSITGRDRADTWIHEAFGTYAEVLYIESEFGKQAAADYVIGRRSTIQNDEPVIPPYGVNAEGSGDMYTKGANLIHMYRQILNDDIQFRNMLLDMNLTYYHKLVDTESILNDMKRLVKTDLTPMFDQYLRTTDIPTLTYSYQKKGKSILLTYRWTTCLEDFNMPVKVWIGNSAQWITPTTTNQTIKLKGNVNGAIVDRNFYVLEQVEGDH